MKRIVVIIVVLVGVFLILYTKKEPQIQSTWIWDTREFQSNQQAYFDFIEKKGLTKLYVQIDTDLSMSQYEAMITEASSRDISVFAIDGAKEWVYHTDELRFKLDWLNQYQGRMAEPAKFSGLLFDVEPYLLTEWETEQEVLLRGYQEVIRLGSSYANATGIPFEVAIPFWFSDIQVDGGALLDWMSSYIDSLVIMSYRTELEGENGLHAIVSPYFGEFKYEGVEVILTVETESLEGEERSITFAEKEEAELNQFIKKVHSFYYKRSDSYQGISVHHLSSWLRLIES